MKAILLDPTDDSRKVIELKEGLNPIYEAIGNGCTTFTSPMTLPNGDAVYCDDEGLFHENIGAFMDFTEHGWTYPLVGRILIVGTDSMGNSVDCKSNVNDFVTWDRLPANNSGLKKWFEQFN